MLNAASDIHSKGYHSPREWDWVGLFLRSTIIGATEAISPTMRTNDVRGTDVAEVGDDPESPGCMTETVLLASLKQPTESRSRTNTV